MSRAMGVVGFFPGDTMTILKCISSVVDRGLVLISSLANAAWVRSGLLGGEGLRASSARVFCTRRLLGASLGSSSTAAFFERFLRILPRVLIILRGFSSGLALLKLCGCKNLRSGSACFVD